MVASSARVRLDYLGPRGNTVLYTAPDGRFGNVIERPKVLAGRLPDPRRAEEVAIGTGMQQVLGAGLGDEFSLLDPSALDPEVRPLLHSPKVRVVGVVAVPNFVVPPRGNAPGGVIFGTPALHEEAVAVSRAVSARHPRTALRGVTGSWCDCGVAPPTFPRSRPRWRGSRTRASSRSSRRPPTARTCGGRCTSRR